MQTQDFDFLLNEATQLLEMADNELSRPHEDVTTISVCQNSRQSLINAMTYFLFTKDIRPYEPVSIESLMLQCKAADSRFNDVDLSVIECAHEENSQSVCYSVSKVNSCYETAKVILGLITEPGNSN